MTRESVMSTPIFDQLLREMAQRAEPHAKPAPAEPTAQQEPEQPRTATPRRRHRAD
jgi:hypothetical protein